MAGPTDQPPSQTDTTPVPDLIERYRLRRDAWIAQADELARLRDEVRGSAEREAMEIVTAARRDVRKVIMEARRELLVLSAQVQAALGEVTANTDPATLLNKAGITPESTRPVLQAGETPTAAEVAVNEILNEVHEDMASLTEDAKSLPLQLVPPRPLEPEMPQPAVIEAEVPHPWAPLPEIEVPSRDALPNEVPAATATADAPSLLSSQFPSEAVPVQAAKRVSAFVTVFVVIGVLVAGTTLWWLTRGTSTNRNPTTASSTAKPAPSASPATEPSTQPAASDAAPSTTKADAGNLSIVAEAVRDVWVRTTIDGRSDNGRTLATGQVIDVSAEQSISLRVGDAGAIVVSVNHGEKRPLGRDGQVMTREFVAEGAKGSEDDPTPAPQAPPRAPANTPGPPVASTPSAPAAAPPVPGQAAPPVQAPVNAGPAQSPVAPAPSQPVASVPVTAPPVSQLAASATQPATPPPVATPAAVPSPPAQSAPPAAAGGSPANRVVAAARQWLDAYHRQDRAAMAALSTDNLLLADERRTEERFAPGATEVTRTLDRVSVQIAADTAVLTAVMIESSSSAPSHVSPISQVWVLDGGQWKVRQARFVSEARLNQAFK